MSKLMSEGKVVPKKDGGDGELKYMWGAAAKTAIFSMFYQRLTDVMEKEIEPTASMQRGIDLEPLAIERFGEIYMQYELISSEELVDTGFILFPDNDGTREWEDGYRGENSTAGVSPDNIILLDGNVFASIETKSRGEEATHSHAYAPFDENHDDWWQVQCQMHALGVEKCYYLHYDDEKPTPWDLQVKEVQLSPIHINKMKKKIKASDELIGGYLKRCKGIELKMPNDANTLITEIRNEIQNLSDTW